MASVSARAAESDDAHWSQIVAAAKREGRVTLYSASVGTQEHVAIARAFEARYGIAVDILEARASEIRERNRVEAASGRRIADVMWNGSTSTGIEEAAGMLAAIGPLPRRNALLPQFDGDGLSIKLALTVYGLLINTGLVSEAAAPKSWRDLADPRWKGKILTDDMRALGGGAVFFFVTYEHLGREFHEAAGAAAAAVLPHPAGKPAPRRARRVCNLLADGAVGEPAPEGPAGARNRS